MKAVVLVGGEGTRLRPLTETIPKPLVPLVDRPFLDHVLDHLAGHGVNEVLLSSPYLEETFGPFIAGRRGDPAITWITEPTPLGTGGAVANAARGLDETFVVCNGDILMNLNLTDLVAWHRGRGAVATITLSAVPDARPFGLVSVDAQHRVTEFREKPQDAVGGLVNAGMYVLEPAAIEDVAAHRAVSIERDTFPSLIASGAGVFGFVSDHYWMDVGTPDQYLRATFDALEGRIEGRRYQAPYLHPTARVSLRAHLGRWLVVGPDVEISDHAEVEDSVLLAGALVMEGANVRDSILGPGACVGAGASLRGAVLAEGAVVPPGMDSAGARVGAGAVLEG